MAKAYIQTGEFAALCGVTKHTLFHYEEIGLLCPVKVDDKGYRYYSIHQLSTFDMIRVLKGMGMSLRDIKDYVDNRDVHAFLAVLKEKNKSIRQEIERLKRLRQMLQRTLDTTEESLHVPLERIQILERPETYFIVTPGASGNTPKDAAKAISYHIAYCRSRHRFHTVTVGEIIGPDQWQEKTFGTTYYSTEIANPIADPQLYHKTAGVYAVQYTTSSYDELPARYEAFIEALRQDGYTPKGALYQDDVRNYIVETDHTQYIMKLEITVTKEGTTGKTRQDSL